jgi:hypothetical protein
MTRRKKTAKRIRPVVKRVAPGDTIAYRRYLQKLEENGNEAALQRELKRVKLSEKELKAIIAKSVPIEQWRD